MEIPEFKRSGNGLIAEFSGIPNGFPYKVLQQATIMADLAI
jgi:hypothetical protein